MARWAICALAVSVCVPAAVAKNKKSLADCTSFQQNDKGDDGVEITVHNSCTVPVDCSVSWRVVCAPDSKTRRAVHDTSKKFSLTTGSEETNEATATICGDDGWTIESIKWGCEPNKN
ncbi:MAG TPA: hypothetical protein VL326_14665 [Kofleriaceae bacterium]|nr:hypothetical protein [Kofleriaceae bacterium]